MNPDTLKENTTKVDNDKKQVNSKNSGNRKSPRGSTKTQRNKNTDTDEIFNYVERLPSQTPLSFQRELSRRKIRLELQDQIHQNPASGSKFWVWVWGSGFNLAIHD